MAGRLAAVPEESMDCSTAAYPPPSAYRDWIRTVAVSGMQRRSTLFSHSQSGHNGFSYSSDSGASNSYPSNSSGCSSGSTAANFGTDELKRIARQMVSDGYTQGLVQAQYGGDPDHALENRFLEIHLAPPEPALHRALESWFLELDVAWVLEIRPFLGSQWMIPLQHPASSMQDLVERWIRGLTVTVYSILELLSIHPVKSVTWFINTSMITMLRFVDAIVPAFKAENLRTVLDMYICVRKAIMEYSKDRLFVDLSLMPRLSDYVDMLNGAISSTMEKVKTRMEENYSWYIGILQGGADVHRNTRWIADCIVSLGEAQFDSTFPSINNSRSISVVRDDRMGYVTDLLLRKSEICPDPSLRYLFLLNNSYFAAQMIEPYEPEHEWELTGECKKYMCSYLEVSWGHVLSCIPESHSPGLLKRWISTPSVAKFESAFNKTYQVQKFWKVPDPRVRDFLRRAITVTVISRYSNYLKEHQKHGQFGNITPNVLEEMLGQLFEG